VVEFGQIYLIVTDERRMVKYVRKGSKPDKILLVSENHERFDDFEIARSKIRRLFLVKGWVNKNEI
jgi:phage repressor protein C with HTH and peptisase S24 domain